MRSRALTVALIIAALVTGACLLPGDPEADSPTSPGEPTPSGTRQSLEGQYSYETMDGYVEQIVPYITSWLDDTWPSMPHPRVTYVPNGASGPENCADSDGGQATYSSMSYEYCPVDQTIYVGQDMLWEFYERTGDAGPAVGLAHEYAHHVQSELGVPVQRMSSVQIENQADCLAGEWTRYSKDVLDVLEPEDDLKDIETLFPLIGSAEDPRRDHGTAEERARSFQVGFDGGGDACGV